MTSEFSNSDDTIDMRDVTERFEELEGMEERDEDEAAEFALLTELLSELKGYGGDHQWLGDWYPGYLIRDSHFEDYAQQMAEDTGAISRDAQWPLHCIDWEKAASELQIDYSTVKFDGVTYWYR